MPTTVEVKATYDGDADAIFDAACGFDEMVAAMSGFATYEGLPKGARAEEGAVYTVDVTFWRLFKMKGHVMEVVKLDRDTRILQSHEHGNGIKEYNHTLSVQPEGDTVVWTDSIYIDAGYQTPFVSRFARYVYTRRHRFRQALAIERRLMPAPKK